MYIDLNQINKSMSLRYSKMKDYLTKYRLKTKQKKTLLFNYLRTERQKIIQRQRKKLLKRLLFWTPLIAGGFLIYNEIYSKKIEVRKMQSKLQRLYSEVMAKETLKEDLVCNTLSPKNIDELANIVSLAHRYHYKVIVRMDGPSKKQKIHLSEQFNTKCLFLNLTALNKQLINPINNTLYVQSGANCQQINQHLKQKGYSPIFPIEFNNEKIYDVITNNLPLNEQQLSKATINMELISASGQYFRSASQTNHYGQIPSLNPLFIGTGGIFALPTAITLKISKLNQAEHAQEYLQIGIHDINQRINFLRKLTDINDDFISVQLSNIHNNQQSNELYLTCRERYPTNRKYIDICSALATSKNMPVTHIVKQQPNTHNFNLFFSANQSIFESFLLKFGTTLPFDFKNGLLKIHISDNQNSEAFTQVINEITLNNGVLVWCKDKELLMRIKPSLDSSEVGAELMHKIVEVRQGLDHRGVLYSHSRYEDYFAKGIFRKLTEFFW